MRLGSWQPTARQIGFDDYFRADDTGRNVPGVNGISTYYASLWPTLI